MTPLALYLRSRHVPPAVLTAVAAVGGLSVLARLADRLDTGVLAGLGVVAGVAVAAPGLAGPDVALDRTAALAWFPRRAGHVVLIGAGIGGAAATAFAGLGVAAVILRDAAGMAGLAGVGAVSVGAGLAWLVPLGWSLVTWVVVAAPDPPMPASLYEALTWTAQPTTSAPAAATAWALAVIGVGVYAAAGPRRA